MLERSGVRVGGVDCRTQAGTAERTGTGTRFVARGKFLSHGWEKFYARGVTYGTFRPRDDGHEYPHPEVVERDFAAMAAHGVNAVRTYTPPPRSLLDAAHDNRLGVMVGLGVERYVGYLSDRGEAPDVESLIRKAVGGCAGHPAILCYALGNEIPAPIVRWHGRWRMERYIERLYRCAKSEDPDGLVTYVNYPSTEYLDLPFLDLVAFNTFLESRSNYEAYLARLQNIAGGRPLILGEVGLDALRHGEEEQARVLDWQVRSAFASGCAGAFVYAWTDEWYRGGEEVLDWSFGLTRRDRQAKPALAAVRSAFAEIPFTQHTRWPRISVVICTYNGARTLRDCLEGIQRLRYPDFEVIVVNDGSTDDTADLAASFPVRLITTENRGLSTARNLGLAEATGTIVAYLDDDAYPDPDWLTYLAATFSSTDHAGVGGPNLAPPGDGMLAECIDKAPGNPTHVLLSDQEAEHIPGCNMAFRKASLEAIGGFDTRFRVAGDDVDVCWRLQERGFTLGFSPAAMVWHHRRGSLVTFWKQQRGYGRAEALLERKWPAKYNEMGHLNWAGRVYGAATANLLGHPGRIYYGVWGSAPFQSRHAGPAGLLAPMTAMPEWYLVIAFLGALSALGVVWHRLYLFLPLFGLALGLQLAQAAATALRVPFASHARASFAKRVAMRLLTAMLQMLQPVARLCGRLDHGLTPWRRRGVVGWSIPRTHRFRLWCERWQAPEERLRALESRLRAGGAVVLRGGAYDRFDLEVRGGLFGAARLMMAVEEHGAGRQLVRIRTSSRFSPRAILLGLPLAGLAAAAAADGALWACVLLAAAALLPIVRALSEAATALGTTLKALPSQGNQDA